MKSSELRTLTGEELIQRLRETKQELFNLRLQQSNGQIERPSRIREVRRTIARIHTIQREQQERAES